LVFDRVNPARLVSAYDIDASMNDVTVIDDVTGDPAHGQYSGKTPGT